MKSLSRIDPEHEVLRDLGLIPRSSAASGLWAGMFFQYPASLLLVFLFYKMIPLGNNQYKVFEKVKLGFFSYSFTYKAFIVALPGGNEVEIKANVMGLARLNLHFKLQESGGTTLIVEQITVKSWLPIKQTMQKVFSEQHALLFKNIENRS